MRAGLFFAVATAIPIATFDGAEETGKWDWETVNDPVMGGVSKSSFSVEGKVGVWKGDVKIVPFLKAPGFCTLRAPGFRKTAKFPDLSQSDGLLVRTAASPTGLKDFRVTLSTEGAGRGMFSDMSYSAEFTATEDFEEVFVPWKAFHCSYHGKKMDWFCPRVNHQLSKVTSIGFATHYPLEAETPFELKIEAISARDSTEPKTGCFFGRCLASSGDVKKAADAVYYSFFASLGRVSSPLIV
jgi:hypothetical protein